jgi:hypothetical protein
MGLDRAVVQACVTDFPCLAHVSLVFVRALADGSSPPQQLLHVHARAPFVRAVFLRRQHARTPKTDQFDVDC